MCVCRKGKERICLCLYLILFLFTKERYRKPLFTLAAAILATVATLAPTVAAPQTKMIMIEIKGAHPMESAIQFASIACLGAIASRRKNKNGCATRANQLHRIHISLAGERGRLECKGSERARKRDWRRAAQPIGRRTLCTPSERGEASDNADGERERETNTETAPPLTHRGRARQCLPLVWPQLTRTNLHSSDPNQVRAVSGRRTGEEPAGSEGLAENNNNNNNKARVQWVACLGRFAYLQQVSKRKSKRKRKTGANRAP